MKSRDVALALVFSPFLLALGLPGLMVAMLIWAIGAVWIAHVVWSFLGGIR